jgi:hypothetical protein
MAMGTARRWVGCTLIALFARAAWAQTPAQPLAPVPPPAATVPRSASPKAPRLTPWPQRNIRFSNRKTVLGLVVDSGKAKARCSGDGTTYFDLASLTESTDAPGMPEIYGVTTGGEVSHLQRKLPLDFTSVSERDFFAGEKTLVTLLEATKRDDGTDAKPPRETAYFLSLSDHVGDFSKLVQLQVRFKPFKVALVGQDDILVLGWDESNLLPVLAVLKDDGTVRRFIDLSGHQDAASDRESAVKALQGAAFVPFGSQELLTYPGTARPIPVLSAVGEDRVIPISLPGGFVLHDVLGSGGGSQLVVRAQQVLDLDKAAGAKPPPPLLFQMSASSGSVLNELIFDKPTVAEVTCAANYGVTAIFHDTITGQDHSGDLASDKTSKQMDQPTRLVVSSTR